MPGAGGLLQGKGQYPFRMRQSQSFLGFWAGGFTVETVKLEKP